MTCKHEWFWDVNFYLWCRKCGACGTAAKR